MAKRTRPQDDEPETFYRVRLLTLRQFDGGKTVTGYPTVVLPRTTGTVIGLHSTEFCAVAWDAALVHGPLPNDLPFDLGWEDHDVPVSEVEFLSVQEDEDL